VFSAALLAGVAYADDAKSPETDANKAAAQTNDTGSDTTAQNKDTSTAKQEATPPDTTKAKTSTKDAASHSCSGENGCGK
jgi:hypothetical protein